MTFIDTHCHFYDAAYADDLEQTIQRALDAGVTTILLPDVDDSTWQPLEALTLRFPNLFRPMVGLHPTEVTDQFEGQLAHIRQHLEHPHEGIHYVALGEFGLDLYHDTSRLDEQRYCFRTQMLWAEEFGLPVSLHIRKAMNEAFGLFRDLGRRSYRGVLHCFSGSLQEAHRAIEMGFLLGIGGVVTFKNASLADIVREVPLESLVLETDAPWLSPTPYRGQRNESAHIPLIAQRIADLRGISIEQVAEATTHNARALFNL